VSKARRVLMPTTVAKAVWTAAMTVTTMMYRQN
jgi:hypothetical protein